MEYETEPVQAHDLHPGDRVVVICEVVGGSNQYDHVYVVPRRYGKLTNPHPWHAGDQQLWTHGSTYVQRLIEEDDLLVRISKILQDRNQCTADGMKAMIPKELVAELLERVVR